jgi:hypothetical protein
LNNEALDHVDNAAWGASAHVAAPCLRAVVLLSINPLHIVHHPVSVQSVQQQRGIALLRHCPVVPFYQLERDTASINRCYELAQQLFFSKHSNNYPSLSILYDNWNSV